MSRGQLLRLGVGLLALLLPIACSQDFVLGQLPDSGPAQSSGKSTGKMAGESCLSYQDCAAQDCASGICVDRSDWTCAVYGNCVWDGGSCRANVASCSSYQDCCSQDCGSGVCLEGNPARIIPADAGPGRTCVTSGSCSGYLDCCIGNCFEGLCAAAPSKELCAFNTPCINYSDCCSFECRAGECTDSTANP